MAKNGLSKLLASKKKALKKLAKTKKAVYVFGFFILLAVAYLSRGLLFAAFVNGQPISRLSVLSELERRGGSQVLDTLITQTLITQEARKQKITVTDVEIQSQIAELETSLEGQGGLDQVLIAEGMTRNDLKNQLRLQILAEKILADNIAVTDQEVSEYIDQNSDLLPEDKTEDELNLIVHDQLKQQKLSSAIQTWLTDLKGKANINYFVDY